jgi:hypothetical protein
MDTLINLGKISNGEVGYLSLIEADRYIDFINKRVHYTYCVSVGKKE